MFLLIQYINTELEEYKLLNVFEKYGLKLFENRRVVVVKRLICESMKVFAMNNVRN